MIPEEEEEKPKRRSSTRASGDDPDIDPIPGQMIQFYPRKRG